MRIGLLSDTHGFLDPAVFGEFAQCDEVWHAGDVGSLVILRQLQQWKPVRAVFGNVDGQDLRTELPEDLCWETDGVKVVMTHVGDRPPKYNPRVRALLAAEQPGIFICGHSHILQVARDPERNLLFLNPGACGHHGWHRVRTLLRFSIENGKVSGMEAIELGPRGRQPHSGASLL